MQARSFDDSDADARIWRIAGPSILSNLLSAFIGIVDIWAIGHTTQEAQLAGLAIGAFLMTNAFMIFSFLYMSTIGLVAQAFGAKLEAKIVETVIRALCISVALGLLCLPVLLVAIFPSVHVWASSNEVSDFAKLYLEIRIWGIPAQLIGMCVSGYLIGTQRSDLALYIKIAMNVLSAALVTLFVFHLGWGVAGAAIGNLVAEWGAAFLGLVVVFSIIKMERVRELLSDREFWRLKSFQKQLKINALFFIRLIFIQLVFAMMSVSGAHLGDVVLAANHVLLQLVLLASLSLAGLGSATQALVGAAIGQNNRESFLFWSLRTARWVFLLGAFFSIIYGLGGQALVSALTDVQTVRIAANEVIIWIAIWPMVAIWSYQLDGIFTGAAGAAQMLWSALFALIVFVVARNIFLSSYGNSGLWISFILFFAARAASLALSYPLLVGRFHSADGTVVSETDGSLFRTLWMRLRRS